MNRLKLLDWNKWLNNTLVFLSPLITIYLVSVVAGIEGDGFQTTDLMPSSVVVGAMALYVLNTLLDFFRKYQKTIKL